MFLSRVQTVGKLLIRKIIISYLDDGGKPLGCTLLAVFQKGGINCPKEILY